MNQGSGHHKASNRRVEKVGSAIRIVKTVLGCSLAQAFVLIRAGGFKIRVNKLDGVALGLRDPDSMTINVDVVNGIVKSAWTA